MDFPTRPKSRVVDSEWEILFQFQKQFRASNYAAIRQFLKSLTLPQSLSQYLSSTAICPSTKQGTLGHSLRTKLSALKADLSGVDYNLFTADLPFLLENFLETNELALNKVGVLTLLLDNDTIKVCTTEKFNQEEFYDIYSHSKILEIPLKFSLHSLLACSGSPSCTTTSGGYGLM
jgi:hypothetical protein